MRLHHRPEGGGSPLVRDWLAGREPAAGFYPGHPRDPASYEARAAFLREGFSRAQREAVARCIEGGGAERDRRLAAFVADGGFVVTTGQQPGLFGGPLYVLYKGLTAVALARRLEAMLDAPVLPVFWIASEDHDWDEARQVQVLDLDNELRLLALPEREGAAPPLHRIVPGEALAGEVERLLAFLPDTDFSPPWAALLEAASEPDTTLPGAMARILDGLLGEAGLFHLQSHAPELKRATGELLLEELEGSEQTEAGLREAGESLRAAGYDLQVPILDGATNVFLEGPMGRERLLRDPVGGFRLRRSGEGWELDALRKRVADEPDVLSPNVLLRPVVEAAFLPTLAYVAGPGESAYLAQTAVLFRHHGIERPVVVPRLSVDLIETKVDKVLEKFDLAPQTLARPHHELAGELLREDLPPAIRRELGAFRGAVGRQAAALSEALKELDPTLKGPVDHVRSQTFAGLDDVERKVVQALKRENEIVLDQLEKAQVHLYPGGRPQERAITFWYHLFRYGPELLERLSEAAEGLLPPVPSRT